MQKYSDTHSIIIGGDFNEDIFSKTNTRRNQLDFMSDNFLYTEEDGITFVNSSGNGTSTIDVLLFKLFKDNVMSIKTLNNIMSNVSDHYPVKAKVKFTCITIIILYSESKYSL